MMSFTAAERPAVRVRLPIAVALGMTVGFATLLHAALAVRLSSPWIVPDELIYSELAKSLAAGGLPAIRDEVSVAYGLGYPLLLAPVWALFEDVPTALFVARELNAFFLSLTAVPAFFLARRFVDPRPALLVATLAVIVPSMVYASTLVTEVALYPAFVVALLAITAALERPTTANQALVFGAIALAVSIKMLAGVLVLAYVGSAALYHWLEARESSAWRGRMKLYMPSWITLFAIAVLGGTASLVAGASPLDYLGAYSVVLGNVDPLAVPWWMLLHIAELDLYVAVIPFAVTLGVVWRGFRRSADRRERLFVALLLPASIALISVVAAFASTPFPGADEYPENVARLHERSTFVLAPLLFLGLVLALTSIPATRRMRVVTAVLAAVLPALIPLEDFVENANFQAPGLVPWAEARAVLAWPIGCLVVTGILATIYVLRSRLTVIVPAIGAMLVMATLVAHGSMKFSSDWARSWTWGTEANWIDHVAGDSTVSVLWAERDGERFVRPVARHRVLWIGELFNRRVGAVYELGAPLPYGLPSEPVRRLSDGRVVLESGRAVPFTDLVFTPCNVRVSGTVLTHDRLTGATITRVSRPVRATVTDPDRCGVPFPLS